MVVEISTDSHSYHENDLLPTETLSYNYVIGQCSTLTGLVTTISTILPAQKQLKAKQSARNIITLYNYFYYIKWKKKMKKDMVH